MAYNISVVITYFMEMLIAYIVFSKIGNLKYKKAVCILVGSIIFETGAAFNIFLSNNVWFNMLYFLIINLAFCLLCFKIKAVYSIFYSLILDILSTGLEFSSIFLISIFTNTEVTAYLDSIAFFILDVSISKTLYFISCILLIRFVKRDKTRIKVPLSIYIYPIVVLACLIIFWSICATDNISYKQQLLLAILSGAMFISIVILFISFQSSIEKENKLISLQNSLDKVKTEKTYYDILEKQNQELLEYAHDTKNHLSAIKNLNSNEQVNAYIETMTKQLKEYSSTCHSGNHTLDVIINKYVTECKIKNLIFNFNIKLSNLNGIDDYDIVTILGNVLDNAVESAINSSEKNVTVLTNYINTYDVITVTNSCDNPPKISGGKIKSAKSDSMHHGLGLKSVSRAVKKYNGDLDWQYDKTNKQFIITIMLLKI